jgi:hypothetical protein
VCWIERWPSQSLNAPRVVVSIGQGVAAGVAEHVGVHRKGKTGARADALDVTVDGIGCERIIAFGAEDEAAVRELPAQLASARTSSPRSECARHWAVAAPVVADCPINVAWRLMARSYKHCGISPRARPTDR